MILPSPRKLGLPKKYTEWRPNQAEAIVDGVECPTWACLQVQRQGRGKTATIMTQAHLLRKRLMRVVVITGNKGLQDQALAEWGPMGLVDIRGANAYTCGANPDRTCEQGSIGKCRYKGSRMCGHTAAVNAAKATDLLITNFSCWIASYKYGRGFGKFDAMICDEAHNAPNEVANAMRVQISDREVTDMLGGNWPDKRELGDMEAWKHWAAVKGVLASVQLQRLKSEVDRDGHPSTRLIKELQAYKSLVRKLADIALCKAEKWIVDEWMYGYQFDPVDASEYTKRMLFRDTDKVILTSGSIRPKTAEMLNLERGDYRFYDYQSEIDPSRSPLMHIKTGVSLTKNTQPFELSRIVRYIDRIIEDRLDRKGIIHTSSFGIRDFIMAHSKFRKIFDTNYRGGEATSAVIERFKFAKAPRVLISPSVTTGYDFPYDMCRFQIIAKLPFPNSYTKIELARSKADPHRGAYQMMQSLAQAFGRGDRADDDFQEVFVLDDLIEWAMRKFADLGPSWLPAYYQSLDKIPPAPRIAA